MSRTRPLLRLTVAALVLLGLAAPVGATAAPLPAGTLTQLPGPTGCVNTSGALGCATSAAQVNGDVLVATATTVYAGSGGSVIAYTRGAGGAVTVAGCKNQGGSSGCTADSQLPDGTSAIAVSPAGDRLYVAGGNTAAGSRIAVIAILPGGGLGAPLGCISEMPGGGCTDVAGIEQPSALAVSPSGGTLYSTSLGTASGGLAAWALDPDGSFATVPRLGPCFAPQGGTTAGCTINDLKLASAVAVQGSILYAAWRGNGGNDEGIESYALAADGKLAAARNDCVGDNSVAEAACPRNVAGMKFPEALEADGTALTVGAYGSISVFAPGPGGTIGARRSCETNSATAGCTTRPGLASVYGLAVPADGVSLYAAVRDGGLWSFRRDPQTGVVTGVTGGPVGGDATNPSTCTTAVGPVGCVYDVAVAPNSPNVYSNGQGGAGNVTGLVAFARQVAPVCAAASAATTAPAAAALQLSCTDANGDPLTYELVGATGGTAAVSATGAATFTPAAGFSGTGTISFRASDGTNASAPATAAITVTAAPAPPGPGGTGGPTGATPGASLDSGIAAIARGARSARLKRFTGVASGRGLRRVQVSVIRRSPGRALRR